jgi:hypothetical protein
MQPVNDALDALPGWDLVSVGLRDRAAGRESVEAVLLEVASLRLRDAGFNVDPSPGDPTIRLYALIEADVGPQRAHSRYNALRARLLSFLRSVDAPAA